MPRKTGGTLSRDRPYISDLIKDAADVERYQIIEAASRGMFYILDHEDDGFIYRDGVHIKAFGSETEASSKILELIEAQKIKLLPKPEKAPKTSKKKAKGTNGVHPPEDVAPEVLAEPVAAPKKRSHHRQPKIEPPPLTVQQVAEERKKDPRGRKPDMRETIRAYLREGKLSHDEIFEKVAPIFKLTIAKRYYVDWYWKEMTKGKPR